MSDASTRRVYTLRAFGQTSIFRASNARQLADRLYTRTHWQHSECARLARDLVRGRVVSAPDYETIVLPGLFEVFEERPDHREVVP